MRGTWTPWGYSQSATRIARGIMHYSTASHGGYHVSPTRLTAMGPLAESPFAGAGWFEEDCDWARVALAFPDEFMSAAPNADRENVMRAARHTLEMYRPNLLARWDAFRAS